jgi:WD40 repeat protein
VQGALDRGDGSHNVRHRGWEFFAKLERVRERRADPAEGWPADNLADLADLARQPPAAATARDLRSEAAAALATPDLRLVGAVADGWKPYAVAFTPDGRALAVAGWRAEPPSAGCVRLYDLSTGAVRRELLFPIDPGWSGKTGASDGCRSVAVSPDGRWLLAGTRGGEIARWDLTRPDPRPVVWPAHREDESDPREVWVTSFVFADGGSVLLTSSLHRIRGWDLRHDFAALPWGAVSGRLPCHVTPAGRKVPVSLDPPGRGRIALFDAGDGTAVEFGARATRHFTSPSDGRFAIEVYAARALRITPFAGLSQAAAVPETRVVPGPLDVMDLALSPDAALLVTTEEHQRRLKLWDVSAEALILDRAMPAGSLRVDLSPDGCRLAVAEENRAAITRFGRPSGRRSPSERSLMPMSSPKAPTAGGSSSCAAK